MRYTVKRVEALLESVGLSTADAKLWRSKWFNLKRSAPSRGVECILTLKQYILLAKKAGITASDIGCHRGQYHMSRIGDTGDYAPGNCRFLPQEENLEERRINGGLEAIAESRIGKTKQNDRSVYRQSRKISKCFVVTSPKGRTYRGLNLQEFCVKKDLNARMMYRVCSGGRPHYRGWTGEYV